MIVSGTKGPKLKKVAKEEVDDALDQVFEGITKALREEERKKITLDGVDNTLDALFDAINRAQYEGKNIKVPDFKRILTGEN